MSANLFVGNAFYSEEQVAEYATQYTIFNNMPDTQRNIFRDVGATPQYWIPGKKGKFIKAIQEQMRKEQKIRNAPTQKIIDPRSDEQIKNWEIYKAKLLEEDAKKKAEKKEKEEKKSQEEFDAFIKKSAQLEEEETKKKAHKQKIEEKKLEEKIEKQKLEEKINTSSNTNVVSTLLAVPKKIVSEFFTEAKPTINKQRQQKPFYTPLNTPRLPSVVSVKSSKTPLHFRNTPAKKNLVSTKEDIDLNNYLDVTKQLKHQAQSRKTAVLKTIAYFSFSDIVSKNFDIYNDKNTFPKITVPALFDKIKIKK